MAVSRRTFVSGAKVAGLNGFLHIYGDKIVTRFEQCARISAGVTYQRFVFQQRVAERTRVEMRLSSRWCASRVGSASGEIMRIKSARRSGFFGGYDQLVLDIGMTFLHGSEREIAAGKRI